MDKNDTPETLKTGLIVVEFYKKEAHAEFSNDYWKHIFRKLVYKKCFRGIRCRSEVKSYKIVETLIQTDLFGQWEKDLLHNQMQIFLRRPEGTAFPKFWKIEEVGSFQIQFEQIYERSGNMNNLCEGTDRLSEFLDIHLDRTKRSEFKKDIMEKFKQMFINSMSDLFSLELNGWEFLRNNLGPVITQDLKIDVDRIRKSKDKTKYVEKTSAEILADIHKVRRYLYYEVNETRELESLGYLDPFALQMGFEEQRNDQFFDGGPVMRDIQNCLGQFDRPNIQFIKPSHGMILWGPPGTGKTKLCEVICRKAGIELVVDPLSSSELNRSKVGETEQLFMALFERAKKLPHLLCCIAIDEIDALTPKRNEKTGEHKADVLCLLLSLIGGIKDVDNVFVIASTNCLNKMDDAFCRRLQTKFFVGRLDQKRRLDVLLKMCNLAINNVNIQFPDYLHPYVQQLSINFSGAAIESFRSRIVSDMYNSQISTVEKQRVLDIAKQVARDFQIYLGNTTVPNLMENNTGFVEFKLKKPRCYSGRVFIDLSNDDCSTIQFEHNNGKGVDEIPLPNVRLTDDAFPSILKFCIDKNVDFVQMFDTSLLLKNAAFDDNTIMETVLAKLGEWEQYQNSMAIFDVDSIAGVNQNMSDSSMGQSLSYSITNNRLWQQVIIQTANTQLNGNNNDDHKWVFVITKNSFIASQFKSLTKFPLSKAEQNVKEENEKTRTCLNCTMPYSNLKNGIDCCNYHAGPLVDVRSRNGQFVSIENDQLLDIIRDSPDRTKVLQNYIYLCCFQGHNSTGCKKGMHSDRDRLTDFDYYLNVF